MKTIILAAVGVLVAASVHTQRSGWVDQLKNPKGGVCCYDNDGRRLDDPEWKVVGDSFDVLFTEGWLHVPTDAVVTMLNQDGLARVWSTKSTGGRTIICFLPGNMS